MAGTTESKSSEYKPNEASFWESLRDNNGKNIIVAVEKIVDWLRAADFELEFEPG